MKPGERIKELRLSREPNQKKFADIIGYSDAYVSEIERGIKEPSPEFLQALEKKFDISPGYILWGLPNDLWNAIKRTFQSEDASEELLQKLRPLLSSSEKDHLYGTVSEPPPGYGDSNTIHEKRLPKNVPIREFIDKVIRILDSGNKTVIGALESNVEAFLQNVELSKPEIKDGD